MNPSPKSTNVITGKEAVGSAALMANSPSSQAMDSIQEVQQQNASYNGMQSQQQNANDSKSLRKKAYVKILEQPAGKALRFRYECEGRSAGSIPGVNSTSENKTYPTIEIVGYKGRAVVVVSCVTKDQPYRPHPHNLVGKEGCKKGVCTLEINPETMRAVFSNLGIQCVKKKDIEAALKAREEIRVDPFKTGFTHRFHPSGIDLNSVRLCFQVFTESDQKGRFTQPLPPVVSDPIYDKKAMCDLVISHLCSCSATVLGNTKIILLCEKVAKEDISVRLFEEKDGQTIWEAYGEFQHTDVHKQTAIVFRTPRYRKIDITEPAKVLIQLKRPSDGVTSEALPFEYVPLDSGRKRFLDLRRNLKRKPDLDIFQEILRTEIKEQEYTAGETAEAFDFSTSTSKALPHPQRFVPQDETILTVTDDKTNIEQEEAKRRSEEEIDLIIDEKMRELEQQHQSESEDHNVSLQEVADLLNADNQHSTDQGKQIPVMDANEKITEWISSSILQQGQNRTFSESVETNSSTTTANTQVARSNSDDKTLDDLLEQVAELDDPAHLKRKRQKTNGDPLHLLREQEKHQHQTDHQDGRKAKTHCWNTTNIPAIKTEPRDASPQPFGIYRVPPDLTPSPQPLSPSSAYSQNTPSPYHVATAVAAGAQSRQPMISPNQQHNASSACGGSNAPLDISNYNAFGQQAQQHHYHISNFGDANAHWESKFSPIAGNNLSNHQSNNAFTLHGVLTPPGAPGYGPNNAGWNIVSNQFYPHPLQQQYPPHNGGVTTSNNGNVANTAAAVANASSASNASHTEHGLSNLLTIDSEQYVRINSEDQQMLRLNSEDLQISNLSIST